MSCGIANQSPGHPFSHGLRLAGLAHLPAIASRIIYRIVPGSVTPLLGSGAQFRVFGSALEYRK
jgi:hypothetical protein